jgi:colanic acid biosynthesis glycosyl transferase WcaI
MRSDPCLKVLLVAMNYAPERSGTAPYTAAWARHMAERHRVTVLAGPPHYPEWRIHDGFGGWREETTEDGVTVRRLRHVVPARPSALGRVLHEATFALRVLTERATRPDVVLAVSPPLFGAAAAARLAHRYEVPFGVVVQDIYTAGVREIAGSIGRGRAGAMIGDLERKVLGGADAILTIHDLFAARLARAIGPSAPPIDVVGNWVHVPEVTSTGAEQRRRLGWADECVVLHAGNMGAKQGLENVVEAARMADTMGLHVRYVLMGDGNQRPRLERMAAGVERLQFIPSAEAAVYAEVLRAADILLINERPGVSEMSLPSKLTSYCAAGRPILAAAGVGGATDIAVRSSGAGIVIEPGEPAAMNKAVLELAGSPQWTAALGARGIAYAQQHHSSTSAMEGYDRWLARLASAGVAGGPTTVG